MGDDTEEPKVAKYQRGTASALGLVPATGDTFNENFEGVTDLEGKYTYIDEE
jgi:hypothetical protein